MAGALGSNSASADALDALEETFNTLLLQMGSVFHNLPDAGQGPRPDNIYLTKCNAHMKQFVPQALSQFQDNLDSLESELVRAQQTIRRDLLLSRIKPEPAREVTPEVAAAAAAAVEDSTTAAAPAQNDADMNEAAPADQKQEPANADTNDDKSKATNQDEILASATSDDGLDAMFNDLTNPDPAPTKDEANVDLSSLTAADDAKQEAENNNVSDSNMNNDDADVSSLLPGLETYANDNALPDFPSGDFDGALGDVSGFGAGDDFNFEELIQGYGGGSGGGGVDGDISAIGDASMTDFNQFDEDFFNI